jgi:hypothetical protein
MSGTAQQLGSKHLLALIPGNTCNSKVNLDRLLINVQPDDRSLLVNVVSVLQVLRGNGATNLSNNLEVVVTSKGYDLISTLTTSLDKEFVITSNDFEERARSNPDQLQP